MLYTDARIPWVRNKNVTRPLPTYRTTLTKTNSVALIPQANYTDWTTVTCRGNLVSTFVDRGVSRDQRGGPPTVVNLSFLDLNRNFSY
jgi:hypothetical protein